MSSPGTSHTAILGSMVLWLVVVHSDKIEKPKYLTAYACEGNTLTIQCFEKHSINLIRANYGRFSISVCNEHGVGDWSVNCMSNRSFRVLQERCNQQNNCSIRASTHTFGDPCPGTWKYLEAHYLCVEDSTTTSPTYSKGIPSWLITKPTFSSDWLLPADTSTTSSSTIPTSVNPQTTTSTLSTLTQPDTTPTTTTITTSTTTENVNVSMTSTSRHVNVTKIGKNLKRDFCPPIRIRGLSWDWTKKGEMSTIPCPGGAAGYAKWHCGIDPVKWVPDNPDLSGCKSAWVSDLKERLDRGGSVLKIAAELAYRSEAEPFYGGDVITMTSMLKKKAAKMANGLSAKKERSKEEMVKELMQSVIETSSNLLSSRQRVTWNDLSRQDQMKAATSLLVGLEDNAYLLADQVNYEKVLVKADRNVMMAIKVYKVQNLKDIHFPTNEDLNNVMWDLATDSIRLPVEVVREKTEDGLVKIIFFTFRNLEELLQPFDAGLSLNLTPILNTRIISAMVGKRRNAILQRPITIILRHLHEFNNSRPIPVYWNYDTNSWSNDGCKVISTNRTHTICSCDHLTNFAVLMDAEETQIPQFSTITLDIVTSFGCIVSIICLVLTILTFIFFRGLQTDRAAIHKNLFTCLLLAEIIFLLGIGQTTGRIICGIVAGVLHFFLLCVFAWTFLEGFQLYMTLIEIFDPEKSRVRWYYVLAYGLPSLIVCASSVIDPLSYGTKEYCWLRTENYFVFSFVGPVIAVVVINLLFLNVAIYMMCWHASVSTALKNKQYSYLANIRTWVWCAVVLVCLLGLTWTFCLLYLNKQSPVTAYAFAILNCTQGIFILVFYCVQNESVQKECKRVFCFHRSITDLYKPEEQDPDAKFCMTSLEKPAMPDSNLNNDKVPNNKLNKTQDDVDRSMNGSIAKVVTLPANASHVCLATEHEVSSCKSSNKDSGNGGSDHEDACANNHHLVDGNLRGRTIVNYTDLPVEPEFLLDYYQKTSKDDNLRDVFVPSRLYVTSDEPADHVYMDVDVVSEPVYDEIEQPLEGFDVNQSSLRTEQNGHRVENQMESFRNGRKQHGRLFL